MGGLSKSAFVPVRVPRICVCSRCSPQLLAGFAIKNAPMTLLGQLRIVFSTTNSCDPDNRMNGKTAAPAAFRHWIVVEIQRCRFAAGRVFRCGLASEQWPVPTPLPKIIKALCGFPLIHQFSLAIECRGFHGQ